MGRWLARILRPDLAATDDRNAWNLCVEIFWASILGSAAAFNAVFAVRLGATNADIGLLNSIPALLAVLVTIPAGRFLEQRARRKTWVLGSLTIHRAGYALVALIPWLPAAGLNLGAVTVALLIAMSIPAHFFGVGFNSMLADVIPERRRATVFATRNIISSGMASVGVLLAGQWLDHITFPFNYQVMFMVGFLASMLSLYYLVKVQVPDSPLAPPMARMTRSWPDQWQALQQAMRDNGQFVRITVNTLFYGLGAWTASPLYILYFIRELGASDAWIGLLGTIGNVTAITGYALWRWVMGRWGESKTLKRTVLGAGLYPLLVGLSPMLTPILFAAGLNGLISPGINLSHFNTLLKVCPEARRPSYIGLYTTIMNAGAFVCPLLGIALAERFGLAPTLIGCGVFWVLGSTTFWIWPVRVADTETTRD
jgi:MFS family permease